MSSLQLNIVRGNAQVTANLSWSGAVPSGTVDYLIFYHVVGQSQIKSISSTSSSVTISNLTNNTQYAFSATAFVGGYINGSVLSETNVMVSIPSTVPDQPNNVVAVVSANGNIISGQVQLSWAEGAVSSYYPTLNYHVYQSTDNVNFTLIESPTALNCNVTGLSNGTLYYFQISEVNLIGESLKASISATPLGLPSVPQGLTVAINHDASDSAQSGFESVDLAWSAPSDNGGSALTNYTIQYSLDPTFASAVFSATSNTTSNILHDANLIIPFADQTTTTGWYYFKVCANSALGSGNFTSATTLMPDILPVAVVGLAGNNLDANGNHAMGTVTLNWSYVIDDSTPLLGYIVAYLDENNDLQPVYVNDISITPDCTISGLVNGRSYDFSVFAFNMLGTGESQDVNVIPSYTPDAPSSAITHGNQTLSLSWNAPDDQGGAILSYNIYRSTDGGDSYTLLANQASPLSFQDTGLTNGDIYTYQVSAINANGEGALSSPISEYPSTIPLPPANGVFALNSNAGANGNELTLIWDEDPVDVNLNGGSMLTMFRVTDSVGNLLGNINSQVDNPSIQVSWDLLNVASNGNDVFPSNGGYPVASYRLQVTNNTLGITAPAFNVSASTSSRVISGLINGNDYSVSISTSNPFGSSAVSVVSCVPSTSPATVRNVSVIPSDSELEVSFSAPLNDASGLPSGGLTYSYNITVSDPEGGIAYTGSNINTTAVNIANLSNSVIYDVAIYADNGVDTNYHVYHTNVQPIPSPDSVINLEWDDTNPNQVALKFNYKTDLYAVDDYLLVIYDVTTLNASCSLIINANSQVTIDGIGNYFYEIQLDSANTASPDLDVTDNLVCALFARNSYGLSSVSNFVVVN